MIMREMRAKSPESVLRRCFSSPTPYGVDSEKPRFSFKFATQISRSCAPRFCLRQNKREPRSGERAGTLRGEGSENEREGKVRVVPEAVRGG